MKGNMMKTNHDPTGDELAKKIQDLERMVAIQEAAARDTSRQLRAARRAQENAKRELMERGEDCLARASWRLRPSMPNAALGDIVIEAMKNATGKDREAIRLAASMRPESDRATILETPVDTSSANERAEDHAAFPENSAGNNEANDADQKPVPNTRPFASKGG